MLAAFLSLPKQFITVYLGVALEDTEKGTCCCRAHQCSWPYMFPRTNQHERQHHQMGRARRYGRDYLCCDVVHLPFDEQGQATGDLREAQGEVGVSIMPNQMFEFDH